MKDTIVSAASKKSATMVAGRRGSNASTSNNGNGANVNSNGNGDWDAKTQPLSNLFHYNMILSPSHEDNDHEEGKNVPVVGVLDFDGEVNKNDREEDNADDCSIDESVLALDMFEGVFDANEETPLDDGITPLDDVDVVVSEDAADTPSVSSSDNSSDNTSLSKRRAEDEEEEEERSIKKSKTHKSNQESPIKSVSVPLPKPKPKDKQTELTPETVKLINTFRDEIVINKEFPKPQHPRRKRPNCMFVNHFGTRMNAKGSVEPVNVPSKNFTKISSEETVSVKTKVTASTRSSESSRSHNTKETPYDVKAETTPSSSSETPTSVPLVVRIVTPNAKKPIRSSRLEDITMEEDDLEPIHHQGGVDQGDDIMVLDSNHLPYINSLSENNHASSSPRSTPPPTTVPGTPNGSSPQMLPNMMSVGPGGMPMNFNRPFPMLQRRMSFMPGGCHPMHPHPAAFAAANGWHGYGPPHPGYGMPQFVPSFHGGAPPPPPPAPASTSASEGRCQSPKK